MDSQLIHLVSTAIGLVMGAIFTWVLMRGQINILKSSVEHERQQAAEKVALLQEAKEALSHQFKSLANDILEEKTKKFTEQNQVNIGQLLDPLRERMTEFKAKVEEIHLKDTEQQAMLKAELHQLKQANLQMTAEAHDLATALKGQAKKQGNWGELLLGNVLDRSGLREGVDFKREVSFNTVEGKRRPDVIVYLPQSKHLVIDAKVSLNAYTRYVNAEEDAIRQQALKEHVEAISSRIKELSNRHYFELPGLNTPEMVFMFIPIESAFVEALRADEGLFQNAVEQNVLVATPTTLLTSLNIVRQLWRFEEQNAHTAELADRAGKVYKKLVTFLGSMEAVGKQLDKAQESFGLAMNQLVSGKGNLIHQAKDFERLGVSIQSELPENLVAKAALELEHVPEDKKSSNHPDQKNHDT
jgi:DNA recombination protein RmuC